MSTQTIAMLIGAFGKAWTMDCCTARAPAIQGPHVGDSSARNLIRSLVWLKYCSSGRVECSSEMSESAGCAALCPASTPAEAGPRAGGVTASPNARTAAFQIFCLLDTGRDLKAELNR
jgi:hypothetical protein